MGNCYGEAPNKNFEIRNEENKTKDPFILEAIKQHNILRANHRAQPLIYSEELSRYSKKWADQLARTGDFSHSNCKLEDGRDIGENIAMCSGEEMTGKSMTMLWYNEIVNYDFNKPQFSTGTGHFTQVVWRDSREIGVGLSKSDNGEYYAVANYYPPGNFIENYRENVLPNYN